MANKEQIAKVADIVEKAPLNEILDTIECVAEFVPVAGNVVAVIIKVLRILIKIQPSTGKAIQGFADMQQNSPEEIKKYASFIPARSDAKINALRTMVDIALEDGLLTEDEVAMLTRKAEDCGLDIDLFTMGLHNELNKQ